MTADFKLVEVSNEDLLRRIYALRVAAWKTYIKVDPTVDVWTDAYDANATHWAIIDGETVAASGRLSIHQSLRDVPDHEVYESVLAADLSSPIASMNRLVVHPGYRGRGLSTWLDNVRVSAAERAGCTCVIGHTNAGDKRVAQLISEGFQVMGTGRPNKHGILKGLVGVVIYCALPRSNQFAAIATNVLAVS